MPLDLAWCIPFSPRTGMYLHGGFGVDFCFFSMKSANTDLSATELRQLYGSTLEQQLYLSYEFGVRLRLNWLMLHASCQKGLPEQPFYSNNKNIRDKYEAGFSLMLPDAEKYRSMREDYNKPVVGISFGYLERRLKSYDDNVLVSQWSFNGIQAGVHFQPCYQSGFGIYTGLYGEWYVSYDELNYTEYNLYIPMDLAWRFPFGKKMALYLHGGLGADYSLYNCITLSGTKQENWYGSSFAFDRINLSYEFGINLRLGLFMLHASLQKGMTETPFGFKYESKTRLDKIEAGFSFAIGRKDM